ncbi:MAG: DUF1553 domain-containing protein [Verrucomicrobiota bacterium]|nr:DUF1553 domain-containing protein [Verrucomicrobiota bacterium]
MGSLLAAQESPAFNRDIRPILADKCLQCHGMDAAARKADLRLDHREDAVRDRNGVQVIRPGDPAASELISRIQHPDPAERMPPPDSGRYLSDRERSLLERWIQGGAPYDVHWAFTQPRKADIPHVQDASWPQGPLDHFILARMEAEGMEPSARAMPERLLRRLAFDLTGLPPHPDEIDLFSKDLSPRALEDWIDLLLARESYGEHMATAWLDAARYADTNGYNNDTPRFQWRWRDWVIDAFNRNLPYDQFLTEQLAGDLIPQGTMEQHLATGFNRNHNVTSEGGIIDEEYRLEYVADRVHTTATVFMGLSMQCARCHAHKFDPISQKEYYAFFAFFNQVPETGYHHEHVGNPNPVISAPTPAQQHTRQKLRETLAEIELEMDVRGHPSEAMLSDWVNGLRSSPNPFPFVSDALLLHEPFDDGLGNGKLGQALQLHAEIQRDVRRGPDLESDQAVSYGAWVFPREGKSMSILSRTPNGNEKQGFVLAFEGGPVSLRILHDGPENAIKVQTRSRVKLKQWTHIFASYDGSSRAGGVRVFLDGVEQPLAIQRDSLQGSIPAQGVFRFGSGAYAAPFEGSIDEVRVYGKTLQPAEVLRLYHSDLVRALLRTSAEEIPEAELTGFNEHYSILQDCEVAALAVMKSTRESQLELLKSSMPTAMVMRDMETSRETFMLGRGAYDQPGAKVLPDVPAVFPPLPVGAPRNRLGLAQWLCAPEHPLTARVFVNRVWYQMLGHGLVETLEDFGSQGAWPSHPELLDWLAVDFVESGWDVKQLLRRIATSAVYQQSARSNPRMIARDPRNQLMARGPRMRLSAEMIRDNALAVSGLLEPVIGGPSVRPYQPEGLWTEVIVADDSYSGGSYQQDHGRDLYRRGVYTWWKRTCPPPGLNTFDAPDREFCTIRRLPTNTPLQALVLMNDVTFVECARKLAERMMHEGGASEHDRCVFGFRWTTSRVPDPGELGILLQAFRQYRGSFASDNTLVQHLLATGESPFDPTLDGPELAAWTMVASMMLNLDESMHR